jgi:hypothetical protein
MKAMLGDEITYSPENVMTLLLTADHSPKVQNRGGGSKN